MVKSISVLDKGSVLIGLPIVCVDPVKFMALVEVVLSVSTSGLRDVLEWISGCVVVASLVRRLISVAPKVLVSCSEALVLRETIGYGIDGGMEATMDGSVSDGVETA